MRAVAAVALCVSLAAQEAPPPVDPTPVAEAVLEPSLPPRAHFRIVHQPPLPAVRGGGPFVNVQTRPIAGRAWTATWTSHPTLPFREMQCALVASQRPAEGGLLPGSRGYRLLVHPDHVIWPVQGNVGVLRQRGGVVTLDMQWPESAAGQRWWLQMLWADPRGFVSTSPMVEITVGRR